MGVPTPAMSPTDLWCVVEPRLCQTGASRTRLPSVCPPWPAQVSWAPTLPLCVTSDWRHRALSPSATGEVLRTPDALGRRWARLTCGPRRAEGAPAGTERTRGEESGPGSLRNTCRVSAESPSAGSPTDCSHPPSSGPQPCDPPPQGSGSLPRPLWGGLSLRLVGRGGRLKDCGCDPFLSHTPPEAYSLRSHHSLSL